MPSFIPGEDDRAPPTQMDPKKDLEKRLVDMGVDVSPRCLSGASTDSANTLRALVDYLATKMESMEKEQHRWRDVFEARLKKVELQTLTSNPFTSDQPKPCDEAHWPGPGGPKWEARLEDVKMLADAQASLQHSAPLPPSGESTKDRLYFPPRAGASANPMASPCIGETKCAFPDPPMMYDDGKLQHDLAQQHHLPEPLKASVADISSSSRHEQLMFHSDELDPIDSTIAESTKQFERLQAELHCLRQDFVSLWMSHNRGREIITFDGTWMDAQTRDKVGEIRRGVMNWAESYKRDTAILIYENEGAEVLHVDIDNVMHQGRVTFCEYSGKRRVEWDSGETWLHAPDDTDIKSRARKAQSAVFRNVVAQVLPFQEQLNMFESRRAHRLRSCASWSLLAFFLWYFIICMYRIAHPVEYYDLIRDAQYWSEGEESLPFIAFDTDMLPAGYELEVSHTDMDNKGHQIEKQVQLEKCRVQQRSRTSDALCMPKATNVLGTFGDPSYKYVKVKVFVPKTVFYKKAWSAMAVYHRFHNNQYARFIESLYFTYPNSLNETSVHELSFEKVDCRNGTAIGIVESLGLDSWLSTERILNLKGMTSRFETLEERDHHVVAMKLYFRAALTEVLEVYEPSSLIDFFEKAGSLFASFGCALAVIVAVGVLVPRMMGRCWYHKKQQDIFRGNSEVSVRA